MWWRRLRWVLALIAVSALATCPTGWRACRGDNRAREAEQLLGYLRDQLGKLDAATHALPRTAAGPTPAVGACCEQGGTCAVDAAQWKTPGWEALAFTIDDPHRFSYSYAPTPDGGAILRAVGDVDCDGTSASVELTLTRTRAGTLHETWSRASE